MLKDISSSCACGVRWRPCPKRWHTLEQLMSVSDARITGSPSRRLDRTCVHVASAARGAIRCSRSGSGIEAIGSSGGGRSTQCAFQASMRRDARIDSSSARSAAAVPGMCHVSMINRSPLTTTMYTTFSWPLRSPRASGSSENHVSPGSPGSTQVRMTPRYRWRGRDPWGPIARSLCRVAAQRHVGRWRCGAVPLGHQRGHQIVDRRPDGWIEQRRLPLTRISVNIGDDPVPERHLGRTIAVLVGNALPADPSRGNREGDIGWPRGSRSPQVGPWSHMVAVPREFGHFSRGGRRRVRGRARPRVRRRRSRTRRGRRPADDPSPVPQPTARSAVTTTAAARAAIMASPSTDPATRSRARSPWPRRGHRRSLMPRHRRGRPARDPCLHLRDLRQKRAARPPARFPRAGRTCRSRCRQRHRMALRAPTPFDRCGGWYATPGGAAHPSRRRACCRSRIASRGCRRDRHRRPRRTRSIAPWDPRAADGYPRVR